MYKRSEAYNLAKEADDITKLKENIESNIYASVNSGCFKYRHDISKYSEITEKIIVEWLESYGYTVTVDKWYDSRSGWHGRTLDISWDEEEE